jgi:exodeoxyribonuclease III
MECPEFDNEGRLITMEFPDFYLINAYIVNAGRGLPRLADKQKFMDLFGDYCEKLRRSKPVIIGGDLNVAHKEIDLKNPKSNTKTAGFTNEEREAFTKFLNLGYIDTFREFVKEGGHYTWWSMRSNDAREKNIGWRLDYFVISAEFCPRLISSEILKEMDAADHCPLRLVVK